MEIFSDSSAGRVKKGYSVLKQIVLFLFLGFWAASITACKYDKLVAVPTCYDGQIQSCAGANRCPGTQICDNQTWGTCQNIAEPTNETCDGLDNDCDGTTDNNITEVGQVCKATGPNCGQGKTQCLSGNLVCAGEVPPNVETCNGEDDDCDGKIDNIKEEFCYSGPPETRGVGECIPGLYRCTADGKTICSHEVTPAIRECSSGKDNDCDGVVDAAQTINPDFDIVFFVDLSGSMSSYYAQISAAIQQFSQNNLTNTHIRMAVVGVPFESEGQCGVISDFKNSSDFAPVASSLSSMRLPYNDEPTLDCPYLAAIQNVPLNLSFRPNAQRLFIMFTDETAQTYLNPALSPGTVTAALNALHARLFVFTVAGIAESYRSIAVGSGGQILDLRATTGSLESILGTLLNSVVCR